MTTPIYPSITDDLLAELELLAIDAFEGQTTRMQLDARKELSEAVPALVARLRELSSREVLLPAVHLTGSIGKVQRLTTDRCRIAIEAAGIKAIWQGPECKECNGTGKERVGDPEIRYDVCLYCRGTGQEPPQ